MVFLVRRFATSGTARYGHDHKLRVTSQEQKRIHFSFVNSIELNLIRNRGNIRVWVLAGNHVLPGIVLNYFYEIGTTQHVKQSPAASHRRDQTRATSCVVACAPPPASCFFLAAQARKLSLSGSLGWAGGALECHPRNSDGGATIELLIVSSVFWVSPSVLVLFGRSSCG